MIAPTKLIGDMSKLKNLVKPGRAGIITNSYGSILEANAEAAELFNVSSAGAMRNLLLVSYVHRASVSLFRNGLKQLRSCKSFESNGDIRIRPRGGKDEFKALIKSRVIAVGNNIVIMVWEVSDANAVAHPSGMYDMKLASGIK